MNKIFTGCIKSPKDKRDLKFETLVALTEITQLPKYIYNPVVISFQDGVGACTGYSGATIKSGIEYKETNNLEKQSGRWVYAFNKRHDGYNGEGSFSRQTMATLKDYGVPLESLLKNEPFTNWQTYKEITEEITPETMADADKKRIEGYAGVSIDLVPNAISKYGFIVFSVPWYAGDHFPVNYIMKETGELYGYHAIACCGYISSFTEDEAVTQLKSMVDGKTTQVSNDKVLLGSRIYLIMANSFAEGYGYKGFVLMPFAPIEIRHSYIEAWAVVSDLPNDWKTPPSHPTIRYGKERTWQTYMQEKKMAFNPWLINKIKRLPTNKEITKLVYGNFDWFSVYEKNRLEYGYTEYLTKDQWTNLKSTATGNVGGDVIRWRNKNRI